MELAVCKILTAQDITFINFIKAAKSSYHDIYFIGILTEELPPGYFDKIKIYFDFLIINHEIKKFDELVIEKLFSLCNKPFLFLTGPNELNQFYDFENFLKIINQIEGSEFSYYLPIIFPSEIFNSYTYQLRIVSRDYRNKPFQFLKNPVYKLAEPDSEELSENLSFCRNAIRQYDSELLKLAYLDLLSINGDHGKAVLLGKRLLKELKIPKLKLKLMINLAENYLMLELTQKACEILREAENYNNCHPVISYLLAIYGNIENKEGYLKKVLDNYEEPTSDRRIKFGKYYTRAALELSETALFAEKVHLYKLAHLNTPDNNEILNRLFDLTIILKYTHSSEKAEISVIVPTYDNYDVFQIMIKTLIINTEKKLEVIVIDDGKLSKEATLFYKKNNWIKVIKNERNLGFIKSVNKGVSIASSEFILILNDDVIITPGAIDLLLENFDEKTGATGPWQDDLMSEFINHAKETEIELTYPIISQDELKNLQPPLITYSQLSWLYNLAQDSLIQTGEKIFRVNSLSGFCLMISRKVVNEILVNGKLLDEVYGFGYFDDFDLSERIKRQGYFLKVIKCSVVFHYGSIATQKRQIRFEKIYLRNKKRFYRKWFPFIKSDPVKCSVCIFFSGNIATLERCIESYEEQCEEIIVCGKELTESVSEIIEKYGADFIIFNGEEKDYRTFVQNRSTGESILFIVA